MADAIELKVEDRNIRELLTKIGHKCEDRRPLMRNIAGIMHDAVEENFEQEGRPHRWKKSKRAEKQGGKTLQDSGQMASSIVERSDNDEAVVTTNKIQAAAHHFGIDKTVNVKQRTRKSGRKSIAKGGGAAHSRKMKIPARPFMVLTDGDKEKITDAARDYLLKN